MVCVVDHIILSGSMHFYNIIIAESERLAANDPGGVNNLNRGFACYCPHSSSDCPTTASSE